LLFAGKTFGKTELFGMGRTNRSLGTSNQGKPLTHTENRPKVVPHTLGSPIRKGGVPGGGGCGGGGDIQKLC